MKYKVLICDRFHQDGLDALNEIKDIVVTHQVTPQIETNVTYPHEILITRSRTKINEGLLRAFPNLQLIISSTSGFDHMDLHAISSRNITVEYCPDANADSAAEMTWALLLSTIRNIPQAHSRVTQGLWRDERLIGHTLKGKSILIIGFGRIGKRVANFAVAFQMKVYVFDPYVESYPSWAHPVTLEEGLQQADVVSLHVPKTQKTFHLLDHEKLSLVRPNTILINTSRGDVVEEKVMLQAIQSKKIVAAGLDVFSKEPLSENAAIYDLKNIVLSPHAGAFTEEAFKQGAFLCVEKIKGFLQGLPPQDPLPPNAKWVQDI